MEKTNVPIENEVQVSEESKKVINQVTDDVSKNIEETIGEAQTTENQTEEENVEKNDDEIVPSTTPTLIGEQENITNTTITVSPSVSHDRATVPFTEVNESEKEANTTIVNGAKNINNKKRELDNEDEQIQEKILHNDERTGDQTKKFKIAESTVTPTVETKESENNIIVNSTNAVEV